MTLSDKSLKYKLGMPFENIVRTVLEEKMPITSIFNEFIDDANRYFMRKLFVSLEKNHPLFCKLLKPKKEILLELGKVNKFSIESHNVKAKIISNNQCLLNYEENHQIIKLHIQLDKVTEIQSYMFLFSKNDSDDYSIRVFSPKSEKVCETVFPESNTQRILNQNLYPLQVNELSSDDKNNFFDYIEYTSTTKTGMSIDISSKLSEEIDGHWQIDAKFKPLELIQTDPSINTLYTTNWAHELQEGDIMLAEIKKNTNIEGVIDQVKKHVRHIKQLCYKTENIFYLLILQGNLTPNDMPSDNFGLPELEFEFNEQVKFLVVCLTTNTLFGQNLNVIITSGRILRKIDEMSKRMDQISGRMDQISKRMDQISERMDQISGQINQILGLLTGNRDSQIPNN